MASARLARLAGAIAAVALIGGGVAIWMSSDLRASLVSLISTQGKPAKKPAEHGPEGVIKLTADQIAKARIDLAAVGSCTITQQITVPGALAPDSDRVGRVAAKVVGTVLEIRKRLGDPVSKGEVVAVLESREVADARSDYLTAVFRLNLQKTLFEREQVLYEKKISAEQQFLRTQNAFLEAELRASIARQKLVALGLSETDRKSAISQGREDHESNTECHHHCGRCNCNWRRCHSFGPSWRRQGRLSSELCSGRGLHDA
jgi:membrane fusion protein, heavy metal efflux system